MASKKLEDILERLAKIVTVIFHPLLIRSTGQKVLPKGRRQPGRLQIKIA
jgi:hypothetical protein